MTFSVKIRSLPDGDWMVYNGVQADSFGSAERQVKRRLASEMGLPENNFATRSYRTDAKSVFSKGLK